MFLLFQEINMDGQDGQDKAEDWLKSADPGDHVWLKRKVRRPLPPIRFHPKQPFYSP